MPKRSFSTKCTLSLSEHGGFDRKEWPVRHGLPMARGIARELDDLSLVDTEGRRVNVQFSCLEYWPDRSFKWLILDFPANVESHGRAEYELCTVAADRSDLSPLISIRDDLFIINTGATEFKVGRGSTLLESVFSNGRQILEDGGGSVRLVTAGAELNFQVTAAEIEENGHIYAAIVKKGHFVDNKGKLFCNCNLRLIFRAGSSVLELQATLHNPKPAHHRGGLWDLGDKGSVCFDKFAVEINLDDKECRYELKPELADNLITTDASSLIIHQNSSGGENWDSPNHVDADNQPTVSYKGYRVYGTSPDGVEQNLKKGERATPWLRIAGSTHSVTGAIEYFWQSFPNTLRATGPTLELGLFPEEQGKPYELQGGEQKRHCVFLDFHKNEIESKVEQYLTPLSVLINQDYLESTAVLPYYVPKNSESYPVYENYIQAIIEGDNSFPAKRERVDEYGWRNFGDQYADHEAVNHDGGSQFVSHYNNQYDFILGAAVQALRSGDQRWYELMEQQALHVMDIDIYRTKSDKHSYNGGLFWHTDHHQNCSTCTHRTYTKSAFDHGAIKGAYGGGPSNEHNYTSGLLHYYYLSGDKDVAATVMGLADWVIALDDGRQGVFAFVDEGPTGLASQTVDVNYHHPGRGAGNSINALIDGYRISGKRHYLQKAEELLVRCIHPEDDIDKLDLTEPEYRWSYLVFLQILGKYLDYKQEIGELDYYFHYARESLLHYADWMMEHEKPYKAVLDKVLLPTETWPAQDVRKSHVLFLAAKYGVSEQKQKYREKAKFFYTTGLDDLLSFPTASFTRPQVIMAVYGYLYQYFSTHQDVVTLSPHNYNFGSPSQFQPQRARLKTALKNKLSIVKDFAVSKLPLRAG
ncbi:hypothetical protein [Desulfogranum marinum]|uniref:RIFT barrel domain-containing protein n=1 Tax=Desulfogranum marinum TaxID=453220 RepID=UPI0019625B73|nr:hypothetical protein [Desulfogranum marinum]MBM9514553.1 hypothetical protein [Desulfogranum marinum]